VGAKRKVRKVMRRMRHLRAMHGFDAWRIHSEAGPARQTVLATSSNSF
jgi:hypothetical protein